MTARAASADRGLTQRESVPLLTAWVSRLAAEVGVRALVIKGPLMVDQGLRLPRASRDVDIWVDPQKLSEIKAALEGFGWFHRYQTQRHWILPEHSVTMRHKLWACELDVHDRFPGFFADRHRVFELMWARREKCRLAGADVSTCDRVGNSAVLALHSLRNLRPGRAMEDLAYLEQVMHDDFSDDEREGFVRLVGAAGANETLASVLCSVGLTPVPGVVATSAQAEDWRVLTVAHYAPSVEWVVLMRKSAVWRWPAIAWRAFWLNATEIRNVQPEAAPGRLGLFAARLRRLRRGVLSLPKAARIVLLRRNG